MFEPKIRTVSQLINSFAIEIEAQLPPLEYYDWVDEQLIQNTWASTDEDSNSFITEVNKVEETLNRFTVTINL